MPLCCSTLDLGCGGGNTPGSCSHSFAHKGMSSATRCSHCTSGFAIFPNSRSYRWHVESWLFILKIRFVLFATEKIMCNGRCCPCAPEVGSAKSRVTSFGTRMFFRSFVLLPGLGTHLCLVAGPRAKYEVSRDRFGRGNLLSRIEEGLKAFESCNCFATLTIGTKLTIIDWGLRIVYIVYLLTTDDCVGPFCAARLLWLMVEHVNMCRY